MPAALEWDKVMGIDPVTIQEREKEQVDDIFDMFTSVILPKSHSRVFITILLSSSVLSGGAGGNSKTPIKACFHTDRRMGGEG